MINPLHPLKPWGYKGNWPALRAGQAISSRDMSGWGVLAQDLLSSVLLTPSSRGVA